MKQSFELIKEYVKRSIFFWNKIQEENDTRIEIEVDEDSTTITLYDSKDPHRFGSIGNFLYGVHAMGYNFTFRWSETYERVELLIF